MSIGITDQYRKNGYGSKLIEYIKKISIKLKIKKLSLYVLTINKPAINLYEKHKFKKIFVDENYYKTLKTKSAFYYELTH